MLMSFMNQIQVIMIAAMTEIRVLLQVVHDSKTDKEREREVF